MMKKIAVVTGTRAEYGILKPVISAIKASETLKLELVVTGMHLSHEFGHTIDVIKDDGFAIAAEADMMPEDDLPVSMAKSIGKGIINLSDVWKSLKPDIILLLGDRTEPLAAAISGAYLGIPVAHIHGGDSSKGGLDESARHAITKFAHIHFPATKKSAERVKKLGEDEWRIHMVGSPALDDILNLPLLPVRETIKRFGIDASQPLVILVQHPVTTETAASARQMKATLEALIEIGHPVIILYPNSDAGGRRMIAVIEDYAKRHKILKTIKSLPRLEYLSLLIVASVLVGNSSSGMIDASSFHLPVVNIGIRQEGRERGENVLDVGHNKAEIVSAVTKALKDGAFRSKVKKSQNPYGDGNASRRIAEVLSKIEITPALLQKKITC